MVGCLLGLSWGHFIDGPKFFNRSSEAENVTVIIILLLLLRSLEDFPAVFLYANKLFKRNKYGSEHF